MIAFHVPPPAVGSRMYAAVKVPSRSLPHSLLMPGVAGMLRVPQVPKERNPGVCRARDMQVVGLTSAAVQEVAESATDEESDIREVETSDMGDEEGEESIESSQEEDGDDGDDGDETEVRKVKADNEDPSLQLVNCGLSEETLRALESRGITALFPIQKHVFQPAMAGKDLICRAKTGSGKTLAFSIPVIENLLTENKETRPRAGRAPRGIVLAPTRELANQVAREFQSAAPSLRLVCCYGGVPVMGQKRALREGVDVVCGTPGRIIDLIEQRSMDLSQIRFVIMDESDQMLDMGFEEDMEQILQHAPEKRQTMLFSATLPQWIKKVARKYLADHIVVDLVGDEATGRISDTIRAMAVVVESRSKKTVLSDLLSVHAGSTNSIVFTKTKREADYVSGVLTEVIPTEALHGDIAQATRETTLERFRDGKFNVLVATDVAARGLDIPNVDLVVHYDMPDSTESFLHRSGRTGRAGKAGSTIVMVDRADTKAFTRILKESNTNIEMIGPPAPREVMQSSAKTVLQRMQVVEPEVVKFFQPAAEKVIASGNQAQVLAAAFAAMSGFSKVPQHRSLLDNRAGYVTLRCMGKPGRLHNKAVIMQLVREILGPESVSKVQKIEMIDDHKTHMTGALFDLPVDSAITFLQNASQNTSNESRGLQFDRPKCLSLDYVLHDSRGGGYGNGGYGGRGGRWGSRGGNRGYDDRYGRDSGRGWNRGGSRDGHRDGGRGGDRWGGRRNDGDRWGSRSGVGGRFDRGDRNSGYGRRESWGDRGYSTRSGSRRGYGTSGRPSYRDDEYKGFNEANHNHEDRAPSRRHPEWDSIGRSDSNSAWW